MGTKKNIAINIGFVLSLVLNGFLLGFMLAGPPMHGMRPPPNPSERLYHAARDLSPESRDKVIAILDKHTREIDAKMHGSGGEYKNIRDALTAKDLDINKLDTLFENVDEHHVQIGNMLSSMMKEIAVALPDVDQRARFFDHALPPEPPFQAPPPR